MLEEMAVPVFFGACTSLGATIFMFMTQLIVFFKFGVFMFTTIGFSLFFSMGMFVTLMGLIGPQGDTGNLVVLFKMLRNWYISKRNSELPLENQGQLAPGSKSSHGSHASLKSVDTPSDDLKITDSSFTKEQMGKRIF